MLFWMRGRRAVALAFTALAMGGLLAGPITARADDGDKGKKEKKGDIIIGPSTIVHDPPPSNPPKKKDK